MKKQSKSHRVKLNRKEYSEYLNTEHWKTLRNEIIKSHPNCFRCLEEAEEVHHLIYREDIVLSEKGDLISVCGKCHEIIHKGIRLGLIPAPARCWRMHQKETFSNDPERVKRRILEVEDDVIDDRDKLLKKKRRLNEEEIRKVNLLLVSYPVLYRKILGFLKVLPRQLETDTFTNLKLEKLNHLLNRFGIKKLARKDSLREASKNVRPQRHKRPTYKMGLKEWKRCRGF